MAKKKYNTQLIIRISNKDKKRFKEASELLNEDMADIIRDFITRFIDEYNNNLQEEWYFAIMLFE